MFDKYFLGIVIAQAEDAFNNKIPSAFLNRFEKQYLSRQQILNVKFEETRNRLRNACLKLTDGLRGR